MKSKIHTYEGQGIEVTYDAKRCIHAKECVHGLGAVFDPNRRPWIVPDNADNDAVAEVVMRCPTGALHVTRSDGGAEEPLPETNRVVVAADGPLYVHGDLRLVTSEGELLLRDTRMALCRCGLSSNKPLCDDSHYEAFTHDGALGTATLKSNGEEGGIKITTAKNGPLLIEGPVEIIGADGASLGGGRAALCRCGQSKNKPFCDGSHRDAGFIG